MKQVCLILAVSLISTVSLAQNIVTPELDFSSGNELYEQPSMNTVDGILERYGSFKGAVLNMTRDEHIIFRAWEGFDKSEARKILKERKDQWRIDHADEIADRKAARMQQTGGCDCWIEPDASYNQITVDDMYYTAGAGEYVDFSTPPHSN